VAVTYCTTAIEKYRQRQYHHLSQGHQTGLSGRWATASMISSGDKISQLQWLMKL
jgi:hypothetical protein